LPFWYYRKYRKYTIIELAKDLNKKIPKPLENEELEKIAKSVLNCNKKDKNYIYKNSKKSGWNIGIMGFEKITKLNYDEYLKEVKRRQKMAGKRTGATIGKEVLIKANKEKAEKTKNKVYKAIKKLKERKEKVTIMKVKELAEVSKSSASKYIKQAKQEGIIYYKTTGRNISQLSISNNY
jgi:hypothetical protein